MEKIVQLAHINKAFPGVKALDDVQLELYAGEVMALLGENGAGKSTLMKVLSGVYARDSGEITVFGRQIGDFSPKLAQECGIAIIHQELNLCTHLTVAENIFLGREPNKRSFVSDKQMRKQAGEVLERLDVDIHPDTVVGDLSLSQQQMVEIAKALSTNARVLIMDEPTSSLTAKEIDKLFGIIRRLRAEGCGVIYISHRLEELQNIADRVTIMRDGHYITSMNFADTTIDEIISFMVGREIKEKFPRVHCEKGHKILEIKNLNAGRLVRNISFDLYRGEIVGIAGLVGAGRTEITRAIVGIDPKESGTILLDGVEVRISKPIDAIRAGIVLVPEDRKKFGLCTKLSVRENIALPNLDILGRRASIIDGRREASMVADTIKNLAVRLATPEMDAGNLSGGNQQKVVVGKWLCRDSKVVIFDEPTRGIDVAAKVEIYNLMNDLKKQGIGVLFVSSEMPEVLGMADRVIVVCDGQVTGEFSAESATQSAILERAMRFESKQGNPVLA